MGTNVLGLYEKALPKELSWEEKFAMLHELGFNYLELSIDESDERLERLTWSRKEREALRATMWKTNSQIKTLMLSGHRRFPLGSLDEAKQKRALVMMEQAIELASDLGIRNIQLAGYDVFYEPKSALTREYFVENLAKCVDMAAKKMVMLSIETMDDPFINSLTKVVYYKQLIKSPWLQAYPDLGNLSAWPENDVSLELENYLGNIVSIHLKDTKPVTTVSKGQFKDVEFGTGCVDFTGLLRTLARLNYSGAYTIELWSGENGASEAYQKVKAAKAYFEAIFDKVGISIEEENQHA